MRWSMIGLLGVAACTTKSGTTAPADTSADSAGPGTEDSSVPPDTADSGSSGETGTPDPTPCARTGGSSLSSSTCALTARCQWHGEQPSGLLGYALAAGMDVDGDGRDDWATGGPTTDPQNADGAWIVDGGVIRIMSGAGITEMESGWLGDLGGRDIGGQLGSSLTLVPDVNGDGLAEILSGAKAASAEDIAERGEVALLLGQAGGWDTPEVLTPTTWFLGERAFARAGTQVAGGADADGDGLGEIWIAGELRQRDEITGYESSAAGRVYRIAGHTEAWTEEANLADSTGLLDGVEPAGAAGTGLAANGDLDGDGYADLVIGAPYGTSSGGWVYALPGGPTAFIGTSSLADAPVQMEGDENGSAFGWAVAMGDITGDGIDDLVIASPMADSAAPDAGMISFVAGQAGFFSSTPTIDARIAGEFDDHQLGTGLIAGPDIDGDGTGDVITGAINAWKGLITKGGRIYGIPGPADRWPDTQTARDAPIQIFGGAVNDYMGRASAVGDFDADGRADLLVGTGFATGLGGSDSGTVYLFWGD